MGGYENKPRIVKLENGTLGKVLIGSHEGTLEKELFYPANYGRYYEKDLSLLENTTYSEATEKDYMEYIETTFVWGEVMKIHSVGEYQIIEYIKEGEKSFHPYINYNDTSMSYESLDQALTGVICEKIEGGNGKANMYLWKMLK